MDPKKSPSEGKGENPFNPVKDSEPPKPAKRNGFCFPFSSGEGRIEWDIFDGKPSVKILFLTDIHWEYERDEGAKTAFLNALVKNAEPDFLMLGGDFVASLKKRNYETVFKVLEGFSELLGRDLFYGLVWGNHDDPSYWETLSSGRLAEEYPHCLYPQADCETARGNDYFINLRKAEKTLWQIYALDTHSMASYPTNPTWGYDTIQEDQAEWFRKEALEAKKENPRAKNLAFFHIPLWETEWAYRLGQAGEKGERKSETGYLGRFSGVAREKAEPRGELGMSNVCTSNVRSPFFACAEDLGSTAAMFYGHDHVNDFAAEFKLKEKDAFIWLVYGLKAGEGIYHDPSLLGGTMIEIRDDMAFSIWRCFQSYEADYDAKKGYREEKIC